LFEIFSKQQRYGASSARFSDGEERERESIRLMVWLKDFVERGTPRKRAESFLVGAQVDFAILGRQKELVKSKDYEDHDQSFRTSHASLDFIA
jgi:hypothetical protein